MISLNVMVAIIGLGLLFLSVFVEAYIYIKSSHWQKRRQLAFIASLLLGASALVFSITADTLLVLMAVIALYKLVNLARIYINRIDENRLRSLSMRTFVALTLLQIILATLWLYQYASTTIILRPLDAIHLTIVAGFICSLILAITTIIKIFKSKPKNKKSLTDKELPSVSVCIAARNETPKLTACLNSVLEDKYPKLEVLVLDDDSQDKTAEIIKSFAKDGVRFVQQEKFNGNWLAKNRAYQTLLEQSSGKLIFYIGVDVRLHKNSIKSLVEQFTYQQCSMMTVIPKRTKSGLVAAFIQPMRYWRELALPKAILKRQPALSTSWLVKRADLQKVEGFNTYKRSIIPEEHLAKLFGNKKAYSYVRTNIEALVTTHKDFLSQWDTSVRTSYPHTHYRPETVFIQSTLLLFFVVAPFILFFGLFYDWYSSPYNYLVIATIATYLVSHIAISFITNPAAALIAPINFPVAVALDIINTHISMYRYEFSKVIWKGRDVAPKKLKVYKSLPEI